jgi:hypothetical protein
MECGVDVRAGTMTCGGPAPGRARGDLLVGGQDVFVKLRSTNVAFAAPTLSADVSLQNLLAQPMGTTDGTTPAPAGVRVFFASQPTTTGGTGNVTVQNPDGVGAFTTAGQPYFAYAGILAPGATSAAKAWQFQVDPGVTFFTFVVYVSAPLPHENGWVDIIDARPALAPGETRTLGAIVVSAAGKEQPDAPVAWASSDGAVATVDSAGTVTAVGVGTATITATSGPRSGTSQVTVALLDTTPPDLAGIAFSPAAAVPGDTVTVTFAASDGGTGVAAVSGTIRFARPLPLGVRVTCSTSALAGGTRAAGTFTCRIPLPPGARDGAWTFSTVSLSDLRGNGRTLNTAALASAGFPTGFTVTDAASDTVPPQLVGETIIPSTANVGDSVGFTVQVSDAGSGVATVQPGLTDPVGRARRCTAATPASGTPTDGTYACKVPIPAGSRPGTWKTASVLITDRTGNQSSGGSILGVPVAGPAPDTTAPTFRGVSISPGSVSRADSVTLTIDAADAGTGVSRATAQFHAPTYNQVASCGQSTLVGGTAAFGTFQCRIGFRDVSEGGTWTLEEIVLEDAAGNTRSILLGDLQAMGYPRTVDVTP